MIKKDRVVSFRLESTTDDIVTKIAERNNLSRAEQYRDIIILYCAKYMLSK